jgi:hypothetical protein
MRLPRHLATAIAAVLLVAACGSTVPGGSPAPSSAGGPTVLPVPVSSELGIGLNRVVFGFIEAATNRQAASEDRDVTVEFTGPGGQRIGPSDMAFVWAIENERGVYVTNADFPAAGEWQALFRMSAPDKPAESVPFTFDVKEDTSVLRAGEAAPAVDTPTAEDVGGDLEKVSTDAKPEPAFYERSIADALEAGDPFVVAFATPAFCVTAQCGPTLDRLKPIARARPDVTFINVEPYQLELVEGRLQPVMSGGDQPSLQPVPAVREFGLLSEPYIFVVDGDGVIRASFEAIFSEEEINAALADLS